MRKRHRWASVVVALVLLIASAPPVAATHTKACGEGGPVLRYSGSVRIPSADPTGIRGTTDYDALDICSSTTDDDRGNFIWVAIDPNNAANDPVSLIQAGRGKCKTNDAHDCDQVQMKWWAWGRKRNTSGCGDVNSVIPRVTLISSWTSGTDQFIVARDGVRWEIFVDGVLEASVSQASVCWNKERATWVGESWDKGDAIGGSSGLKFAMTSAAYQTSVGGAWTSPGFGAGANCTVRSNKYECITPSSTSLNFWTDQADE